MVLLFDRWLQELPVQQQQHHAYAAISAAYHNIQNIACIDHAKQYFVSKSIKIWLDKSAIIPLICVFGIGVGDGGMHIG